MSLNKVILIGHLGRDPEFRYMTNGESGGGTHRQPPAAPVTGIDDDIPY